jgi:hypothetical protein
VRDSAAKEALRRLAAEAATRFTSLVATGEELPFDVAESSGEHTFYRYLPLTDRFVRQHAGELRSLPSFAAACSAVDTAGIAAPYLEARGETVAAEPVQRAEQMLIGFIARLWEGSTEFTLEKPRLEAALRELEAEARDAVEADLLIAPLVGLRMPSARLELPGVRIVRADTVDAPPEAARSEGMGRNAWEPQFLALAEQGQGRGRTASAMRLLCELISVLRLFKEGGVGLGPYAFAPTGEGKWKRVATGAAATRPGGYGLSEAEAAELASFAQRLESRPNPDGTLRWAVARFELGCDRRDVLEGLSDHLLAIRALFEDAGVVRAGIPMRAASLIAEPDDRPQARAKLRAAFELERAMMAGRKLDLDAATALAAWVEGATRAIVRGAALGELGSDVAASADETLVAAALEVGEGSVEQMGEDAEWELVMEEDSGEKTGSEIVVPEARAIRIRAGDRKDVEKLRCDEHDDGHELDEDEHDEHEHPYEHDHKETTVSTPTERDWLSEVSQSDRGDTLEWPAPQSDRSREQRQWREESEHEEPLDSPRVRHLFPAPDDADWEIGELDYDRSGTRVG